MKWRQKKISFIAVDIILSHELLLYNKYIILFVEESDKEFP